jgi:hypothetical protein
MLLILSRLVVGQDNIDTTYSINDLYIDYSVTDFSAFNMLGISEEKIIRPGNLKQFSAGLANFLSSGNNIQSGFATEYAPKNFKKKRDEEWWNKRIRWDNFSFTLATASDDSLGTMLSGGVKWVPINNSESFGDSEFYNEVLLTAKSIFNDAKKELSNDNDSLHHFILKKIDDDLNKLKSVLDSSFEFVMNEEFHDNSKKISKGEIHVPIQKFSNRFFEALSVYNVTLTDSDSAKIIYFSTKYVNWHFKSKSNEEKVKAKIIKLKEEYKNANWYKGAIMFSGGIVGNSLEGTYESLKYRNFSLIVTGSMGIPLKKYDKLNAQILLQGKFDGALIDTVEYTNKFSFGSRFIIGNSDNRISIECLYSSTQLSEVHQTSEYNQIRYLKYALGVELKISDGTWLELAIGGQKYYEGKSETVIIPSFTFKHALQTKKRYN